MGRYFSILAELVFVCLQSSKNFFSLGFQIASCHGSSVNFLQTEKIWDSHKCKTRPFSKTKQLLVKKHWKNTFLSTV